MKRIRMTYLDNNHYIISGKAAHYLAKHFANRNVPKDGYEIMIQVNFYFFWLKKTMTQGKAVWCLHNVNQYQLPYMGDINLTGHLYQQIKDKGYINL